MKFSLGFEGDPEQTIVRCGYVEPYEGMGEQLFEGTTMLLAAGLLTWMIFWMQRRARSLKSEMEANVNQALLHTGKGALFGLAFVAVVREGLELALYLVAARMASSPLQTIIGAFLGLAGASLLGWVMFATSRRLNLSTFFRFTNLLLVVFAAGLVAHTFHEYTEAGLLPTLLNPVWNLSGVLSDESSVGQILSTLFGYHSSPNLLLVIGYLGYIVLVGLGLRQGSRIESIKNQPA